MTNIDGLIQGMFIVSLLTILYGISIFLYLKKRIYPTLFLIVFSGFALRLFCSSNPMLHPWDERYHALVAKNIMEQPFEPKLYKYHVLDYDYRSWTANKVWLHKQPIPLWSMALSLKVFGVNEFSLRLPSVFLSTFCIYLTFCISLLLFGSDRVGLIAAFLHSINGLAIELSSGKVATDHIDTFFLFFTELSIFFVLLNAKNGKKVFMFVAGIACGAAILTKWLPALIIFPLYLAINAKNKNKRQLLTDLIILSTTISLTALPWQIYAQWLFPLEYQWEQHFNKLHFTEGLEGNGGAWWYFVDRIRINVNEMIYIILLWFFYDALQKENKALKSENLFLLIYIAVPFLVFSIAKTKMPGYLLFTFPAYFIISGLFIERLVFSAHGVLRKTKFQKFNIFIVTVIFALAIRYGLERVKPFKTHEKEMLAKKEMMRTNFPPKSVVFNIPYPIELMFYASCIAYPVIPDSSLINQLYDKNYHLFIVDNDDLSNNVKKNSKIKKIKLPAVMSQNH